MSRARALNDSSLRELYRRGLYRDDIPLLRASRYNLLPQKERFLLEVETIGGSNFTNTDQGLSEAYAICERAANVSATSKHKAYIDWFGVGNFVLDLDYHLDI